MDRTGSLGANVHPLEHAVRITFDSSPATAKVVQAHATFKRTVLVPDEHGYLPKKLYQPQFWLVKLTVPKGLPLQKGTGVHDVKLRPDGRQFGSDGCKDALKEISSISLEGCHYAWLEDPEVVISHRWSCSRYPPGSRQPTSFAACVKTLRRDSYHTLLPRMSITLGLGQVSPRLCWAPTLSRSSNYTCRIRFKVSWSY